MAFVGEAEDDAPPEEFNESEVPILAILKERLRPFEFELIKVWRFAQTEGNDG